MDEKEVSEMQEEMMTVLVVEPMKAPYVKHIPNELEDLQQAVGGDIEITYPFDDEVGILLNGNGKFEGLPLNRALYDDHGQVYDALHLPIYRNVRPDTAGVHPGTDENSGWTEGM